MDINTEFIFVITLQTHLPYIVSPVRLCWCIVRERAAVAGLSVYGLKKRVIEKDKNKCQLFQKRKLNKTLFVYKHICNNQVCIFFTMSFGKAAQKFTVYFLVFKVYIGS